MNERTVNVGILGLGFMGQTHLGAYRAAHERGFKNRLAAICDADPQRRTGRSAAGGNIGEKEEGVDLFDPAEVRAYAEPAELFADPEVELISICTHTDTHVDLAIGALEAGKHVLVEKPVATSATAVDRLAAAAREASTLCMPAHCIRFWPGWDWLHERIEQGTYGAVRSAVFRRLASPPAWAPDFYRDSARTGGALIDLHIHDADFVQFLFGMPRAVVSTGFVGRGGSVEHIDTHYHYGGKSMSITAEGGWLAQGGCPFEHGYDVYFEDATLKFNSSWGLPPQLLTRDGKTRKPRLPGKDGFIGELQEAVDAVRNGKPSKVLGGQSARNSLALCLKEVQSVKAGRKVTI